MLSLEKCLEKLDIDAVAFPEDKLDECEYFYSLLKNESDRDKFRWLLSAFLGASFSFLEIKAKNIYFAFCNPETGEQDKDEKSLEIFHQYIETNQRKNNPRFIKSIALHELIRTLYKTRNSNTHHSALPIMRQNSNNPEKYLIGSIDGDGVPALKFCRDILVLFAIINKEIEGDI